MIDTHTSTLQDLIGQSLSAFGPRTAIAAGDGTLTYEQLAQRARAIASKLDHEVRTRGAPRLMGVYGGQTSDTYAAIVAALVAGAGYVPLNPDFPPERNAFMIADSGLRVLYVSKAEAASFALIAPLLKPGIDIIGSEQALSTTSTSSFPTAEPSQAGYILYTSGSTGRPKGVMVSHGNILHYVRQMMDRYRFTPDDRFSQTFDLTFDLSAIGTFCALACGGSIYPLGRKDKLSPVRYVRANSLTVWSSVPSLAIYAQKLNMLKAGVMPSLRLSIFCGEALTVKTANQWQAASPHAILDNHYGPTEATISCSWHRWDEAARKHEPRNGILPIGLPIPGTSLAVADANGHFVPAGVEGELCIGGAQVCIGYTDESKTRAAFFEQEDPVTRTADRWYRTGDRAVFNSALGAYEYLGRVDSQVKIQGYRVELGEVENVIRAAYGSDAVAVVPHPVEDGTVKGLVAFLEDQPGRPQGDDLAAACRARMPDYMCPADFRFLDRLPLNPNGKVDRRELARKCG